MTLRVIHWGTGNSGMFGLRAIIERADLELVGLRVFSPTKVGRDAGVLAGGKPMGIIASEDVDELLSLSADCLLYMAAANGLMDPALPGSPTAPLVEDMCRFLASGCNVVCTTVPQLTYPPAVGSDVTARLAEACKQGKTSYVCIGIDPGFMNDLLPLALSGFTRSIRSVVAQEILNYGTYDAPEALHEMGYGLPPPNGGFLQGAEGRLSCWGTAPKAIAHELGVQLDEVRLREDFALSTFAFDIPAFHVPQGVVAAQRFAAQGMLNGQPVIVAEHVTRLHDDVAPDWPKLKSGSGGWRILLDATPPTITEVVLGISPTGERTDPCIDACQMTAARAVNAIPLICDAPTGVHSQFTLPLVAGRGLMRL